MGNPIYYRGLLGSTRDAGPVGPATRGAVWATRNCQSWCGAGMGQIFASAGAVRATRKHCGAGAVRVEVFCG